MPTTTDNPRFSKDPNSTRKFGVDWTQSEIVTGGATLSSVTATATPAGLTVTSPGTVSGAVGTVLIAGGTTGTTYEVAFSGTFSDSQIDVQRILIAVREIPVGLP